MAGTYDAAIPGTMDWPNEIRVEDIRNSHNLMTPGEITTQLREWGQGDLSALDRLTPLVYERIRTLAGVYLRQEQNGAPIQPTELVNELFVELLQWKKVEIKDRNHFFALAARIMRQILVHHARRTGTERRGAGAYHLPLENELAWTSNLGDGVGNLDLHSVMEELEFLDEPAVRAVELRYLFGFTAEETAEVMGTSKSTVDRQIRFALSWMHSRLHPET